MARFSLLLLMLSLVSITAAPTASATPITPAAFLPSNVALALDDDELRAELMRRMEELMARQRDEMVRDLERMLAERNKSEARHKESLAAAQDKVKKLEAVVADLQKEIENLRRALEESRRVGAERDTARRDARRQAQEARRKAEEADLAAREAARKAAEQATRDAADSAIVGFAFSRPTPADVADRFKIDADKCMMVTFVLDGSPAAKNGIKAGDVITQINGKPANSEAFLEVMKSKRPGDSISIKFVRDVDGRMVDFDARPKVVSRNAFAAAIARAEGGEAPPPVVPETRRKPVTPPERATSDAKVSLGVSVRQEEDFRLIVTAVTPGGNAAEAGLRVGDQLISLAGNNVRTLDGVRDVLQRLKVGQESTIVVRRGENLVSATLVLGGGDRKPVLKSLKETGPGAPEVVEEVRERRPGFFGVQLTDGEGGVSVFGVQEGAAAAKMGLKQGDVIESINGKSTGDLDALRGVLSKLFEGDKVQVSVRRGDGKVMLEGKLGARPENPEAAVRAPGGVRSGGAGIGGRVVEVVKPTVREPSASKPGALGLAGFEANGGVQIDEVLAGSGAGKAGVKNGDVIVGINDHKVADLGSLRKAMSGMSAGETISVKVKRGTDSPMIVKVTLTDRAGYEKEAAPVKATDADKKTDKAVIPAKRIVPGAIAQSMKKKEAPKPTSPKKAFLGVTLEEIISTARIRVISVEPGGPAATAGLRKDDEIVSIGDQPVKKLDAVRDLLERHRPGQEMIVKVKRDGKDIELTVTLGSFQPNFEPEH